MKNILGKILIVILILILSNVLLLFLNYSNAASNIVIVLDPGHGPSDSGAIGNGVEEREVTLKIAKYLKDELEARNPNITVYLTHHGDFNAKKIEVSERANIAANLGADIVISLHINSEKNGTTANGAEVFVTRDTCEDRYNKNCRLLGDLILGQLSNLGIYNRGTKNSPVGNTQTPNNKEYYDSGIEVDYYGMIRYPRKLGIPGIIVEHCFISNASDVQRFISNDEQIKNMAKADANAILEAVSKGYIAKKAVISTVSGITPGTKISDYTRFNQAGRTVAFFDKSGNQLGGSETLKTGTKIVVKEGETVLEEHTVVIYGDTNGDGAINLTDALLIEKNYVGLYTLQNEFLKAGSIVNRSTKVTLTDALKIKRHYVELENITQ